MITILSIIGGLVYLTGAGFTFGAFLRFVRQRCKRCKVGKNCYDLHQSSSAIVGIFWIPMTPFMLGYFISERTGTKEAREAAKEKREKARHERRMAELKEQQKLAEISRVETMDNIKFLIENGIKADVPGLYDVGDVGRA